MRRLAVLMLGLLLQACAAPQPVAIGPAVRAASLNLPLSPSPDDNGAREGEGLLGYIAMADGIDLPLRATLPDGPPRAVLIALHGFNDYSRFIDDAARHWRGLGIATYAYDQRGFGRADPVGRWTGHGQMIDDLAVLARLVAGRHPDAPVYVLGESMGGAIALLAEHGGHLPGVRGVILSAPAVWGRATMGLMPRVALALSSRLVPGWRVSGEGLRIQPSDNIEMLRALGRDPLVIKRTRIDTIFGLTDLMDAALAEGGQGRLPTLFLYGARDEIIPHRPTCRVLAQFAERHALADSGGVRLAYYSSGYHMLLRDLSARVVLDDIAAWIADPAGPLPSGAEAGPFRPLIQARTHPIFAEC